MGREVEGRGRRGTVLAAAPPPPLEHLTTFLGFGTPFMRRNHEPSRQQRQPLGQRSIAALTMLSAPKQAQQRQQPWVAADTAAGPGVYVAPHPSTLGAMVTSGDGGSECTYNTNDNGNVCPGVHGSSIMSVMGRARASSSVAQGGGAYANGDIHSAAAAGDMARVAEHLRRGDAGGGSGGGGDGKVDVRDGRQWSLLHHGACYFVVVACLDAYTTTAAAGAIGPTMVDAVPSFTV